MDNYLDASKPYLRQFDGYISLIDIYPLKIKSYLALFKVSLSLSFLKLKL